MSLGSQVGRVQYAKKESAWGTLPGTGSFRTLRRVTYNVNPIKDKYDSNEVRQDQQRSPSRFGGFRVEGSLEGELSAGSYQPEFEAVLRSAAAGVTLITGLSVTVAGAGPTYTFTRGSGSYITDGIRVGMVVRFTAALNALTINRNIIVTSLTALILTGLPLDLGVVVTEGPVAAVSLSMPGKRAWFPASGHTEDSFTHEDKLKSTLYRQLLGMELNTFAADLSPNAPAKVSWGFLGKSSTTATSQYSVSPSAATTSPVLDGPTGVVLIDGSPILIASQLTFNTNGDLSTQPVIGSRAVPAIFQGTFTGAGQLKSFIDDSTLMDHFDAETRFEVIAILKESSANTTDFVAFHLPECRASKADITDSKALEITVPFDFRRLDTTTGYDATTMSVQDSRFS